MLSSFLVFCVSYLNMNNVHFTICSLCIVWCDKINISSGSFTESAFWTFGFKMSFVRIFKCPISNCLQIVQLCMLDGEANVKEFICHCHIVCKDWKRSIQFDIDFTLTSSMTVKIQLVWRLNRFFRNHFNTVTDKHIINFMWTANLSVKKKV